MGASCPLIWLISVECWMWRMRNHEGNRIHSKSQFSCISCLMKLCLLSGPRDLKRANITNCPFKASCNYIPSKNQFCLEQKRWIGRLCCSWIDRKINKRKHCLLNFCRYGAQFSIWTRSDVRPLICVLDSVKSKHGLFWISSHFWFDER